jgi:hypothetical protein
MSELKITRFSTSKSNDILYAIKGGELFIVEICKEQDDFMVKSVKETGLKLSLSKITIGGVEPLHDMDLNIISIQSCPRSNIMPPINVFEPYLIQPHDDEINYMYIINNTLVKSSLQEGTPLITSTDSSITVKETNITDLMIVSFTKAILLGCYTKSMNVVKSTKQASVKTKSVWCNVVKKTTKPKHVLNKLRQILNILKSSRDSLPAYVYLPIKGGDKILKTFSNIRDVIDQDDIKQLYEIRDTPAFLAVADEFSHNNYVITCSNKQAYGNQLVIAVKSQDSQKELTDF